MNKMEGHISQLQDITEFQLSRLCQPFTFNKHSAIGANVADAPAAAIQCQYGVTAGNCGDRDAYIAQTAASDGAFRRQYGKTLTVLTDKHSQRRAGCFAAKQTAAAGDQQPDRNDRKQYPYNGGEITDE